MEQVVNHKHIPGTRSLNRVVDSETVADGLYFLLFSLQILEELGSAASV